MLCYILKPLLQCVCVCVCVFYPDDQLFDSLMTSPKNHRIFDGHWPKLPSKFTGA